MSLISFPFRLIWIAWRNKCTPAYDLQSVIKAASSVTQRSQRDQQLKSRYSYASYCDGLGIETTIPQKIPFEDKKSLYSYQAPTKDKYPPHLDIVPSQDKVYQWQLFNALGLLGIGTLLPKIVPDTFLGKVSYGLQARLLDLIHGRAEQGLTIADIEKQNREMRATGTDIMRGPNIGDYDDWYSDARFAEQQLTGVNPATIRLASGDWIERFRAAAKHQGLDQVEKLITSAEPESFYIQDCSYFREAIKLPPDETMISEQASGNRFTCASVSLFHLNADGLLHPLSIICDYKGSMEKSVTIFNKRVSPSDDVSKERTDWPWRYAKTCAQVSDWQRHEITVHLTETHFIEEAIIVATHRCIPQGHPVYALLEPHWLRTLSLNAAARDTLVPHVIFDIVGFTNDQCYNFVRHAYDHFDFKARYVPNDLQTRGFPIEELDSPKFKNYAFGRNIILLWKAIRRYIASMIDLTALKDDAAVAADEPIKAWCSEIQRKDGGQIPTFPTIKTTEELVDAITMCIHIAAPQHTAVNYLQNFYQAFVINRPAALYAPLPKTRTELQSYKESDLVKALPIGRTREWLLSSHVPHLLSYKVADRNNLINYAASIYNIYKYKKGKGEPEIRDNAEKFYCDLRELMIKFKEHSDQMTKGTIAYEVMDPNATAVSILI